MTETLVIYTGLLVLLCNEIEAAMKGQTCTSDWGDKKFIQNYGGEVATQKIKKELGG